jgi:hypothetical protein
MTMNFKFGLTLEVWEVVEFGSNELRNLIPITTTAPHSRDCVGYVIRYY